MKIRISRRAAERLRAGHLWVYRTELVSEAGAAGVSPGALVRVEDAAGRVLGAGLYSAASQIALRMVSRDGGLTRAGYLEQLRERVRAALARRRAVAPPGEGTTAGRILFSEADGVPGIVADRYGELVIAQLLTQGTAQADVRAVLGEVLRAEFSPAGEPLTVWERPDGRIRELEALEAAPDTPLLHVGAGEPALQTEFLLNGLRCRRLLEVSGPRPLELSGSKDGVDKDERARSSAC